MAQSTRKKLLFLVTSSGWGGAERYVARLSKDAVRDFDVTVMAGDGDSGELFAHLSDGVKHGTLHGLASRISPLRDLAVIRSLSQTIDREGFDLIHCNSTKAGMVGALAAARSQRKPRVIYTAHGWAFLEKRSLPFRLLTLWSEKLSARHRDATIVLSEAEREIALVHRLSTPERLHLIPHGIDHGEITFLDREVAHDLLKKRVPIDHTAPILGTIANAYAPKALPLMIEAFGQAGLPDAQLVIIGDGPRMDEVRAARNASPAKKRIFLPGAMPDAARLLNGFDVFVLSSVKEGLPWVILEASLAGVPIIATKVGALPEIIGEGEGLLVPPGDVAALAEAMRTVMQNPPLLEKLKTGAPRIAERRSGKAMSDATLGLYHRTLGG